MSKRGRRKFRPEDEELGDGVPIPRPSTESYFRNKHDKTLPRHALHKRGRNRGL